MNLKGAVWRIVSIQSGEFTFVIPLYFLYFLSGSCYAFGQIYSETLFLKTYGAAGFSGFFVQSGITLIIGGLLYNYLILKIDPHRGYLYLIAAVAMPLVSSFFFIDRLPRWFPFYLYLGNFLSSFFLDMHFFNYTYRYLNIRNSRRIIPFLIGGGKLGGVVTSAVIFSFLSESMERTGPLLWAGNAVLLAFPLLYLQARNVPRYRSSNRGDPAPGPERPVLQRIGNRIRSSYSSPIFLYSVMAVFVMAVLNQVSEYYFAGIINASFPSKQELTSFLSMYTLTTDMATLVVTTTLTARIIRRAGVPGSNLAYPVSFFALFLIFIASPGLAAAILLRFNKKNMAPILRSPVFNIIMASSPRDRMAEVKSFISGIVNPLGMVAGGAAILLIHDGLPRTGGYALTLLLGAVYIALTLFQNRAYVDSLKQTLAGGARRYGSAVLGYDEVKKLALMEKSSARAAKLMEDLFNDSPSMELLESIAGAYDSLSPDTREAMLRYLKTTRYRGEKEILAMAVRDRSPLVRSLAYSIIGGYSAEDRRGILAGRRLETVLAVEPFAVRKLLDEDVNESGEEVTGRIVRGILEENMKLAEFIMLFHVLPFETVRGFAILIAHKTSNPLILRYLLPYMNSLDRIETASLLDAYINADLRFLTPLFAMSENITPREILFLLDNRPGIQERDMENMFRFRENGDTVQLIEKALFDDIGFHRKANYLAYLEAADARPIKTIHRFLEHETSLFAALIEIKRGVTTGSHGRAEPFLDRFMDLVLTEALDKHRVLVLKALGLLTGIDIDRVYEAALLLQDADMSGYLLEYLESAGGDHKKAAALLSGAAFPESEKAGGPTRPLSEGIAHLTNFIPAIAEHIETAFRETADRARPEAEGPPIVLIKEEHDMLDQIGKIVILQENPLFGGLPVTELVRLAGITTERDLEADRIMIRQGDPGDELFILVEGEVEVFSGERTVSTLGPGSCIGELSVIDTEPRSSSVRTLTRCRFLSIKRNDFIVAIREEPSIAINVMKILADRLRCHLAAERSAGGNR